MEILDLIRKQTNNIGLNVGEANEMDKVIVECKNNGFVPSNSYTLRRNELRSISFNVGTEIAETETNPSTDLLSDVRYYSNIKSNLNVPYLHTDNVKWGNISDYAELHNSSVHLKPKRICTYIDISTSVDVQNKSLSKDIANILNKAIYDKVVETMFSNDKVTDAPNGLFADMSIKTISEDNILDSVLSVTQNKYNGKFVISPSAYISLFKNNRTLFDNGKLVGFEYVVDGRVKDGYLCFIDLSKVVMADWTITSITIDNVCKVKDGIIRIIAESFVDFDILDKAALSVLKTN